MDLTRKLPPFPFSEPVAGAGAGTQEDMVSAGGWKKCDDWQGKPNSEGERRLLGNREKKVTVHQAELSMLLRRSRGGCVYTLPAGRPSVRLLLMRSFSQQACSL